jgi:D-glycero-D-manno-heptose 1,7-bisphosphate phosphatase
MTLPTRTPSRVGRFADVRTVFLDRDGVINENRADHVKIWAEFAFLPGAVAAIARLSRSGKRVFVATNQSVINRGLATRATIEGIHGRMVREIEQFGGQIEAVACCPHRPDEGCPCRKPQPGLLLNLAREHALDLGSAVVIGDAPSDAQAGIAAGCRAILVRTGPDLNAFEPGWSDDLVVASDLGEAVDLLLEPIPVSAA